MAAFDVRLPFACLISGAIIEKKIEFRTFLYDVNQTALCFFC